MGGQLRSPRCGEDVDKRQDTMISQSGRRWHYLCWRAYERDREWLSEAEVDSAGGVE